MTSYHKRTSLGVLLECLSTLLISRVLAARQLLVELLIGKECWNTATTIYCERRIGELEPMCHVDGWGVVETLSETCAAPN